MKLHYYPETDSLYIELKDIPGVQRREVALGLNVDLDENGEASASTSITLRASSTSRKSKPSRCRLPLPRSEGCDAVRGWRRSKRRRAGRRFCCGGVRQDYRADARASGRAGDYCEGLGDNAERRVGGPDCWLKGYFDRDR
jgi:uncharacterized protein YuzE